MNILLVGHKGYVGSGLRRYFSSRHCVVGWGREEDLFALTASHLERERIDVLINCAAEMERGPGPYRLDGPGDRVNAQGARHLASILKGTSVLWFQISTREVFGPVYGAKDVLRTKEGHRPAFLVEDDRPYAPVNPYGKSKVIAELLAESHELCNVIRLCTCYHDFDHPRGNWMVGLIKAALAGRPAKLAGGGRQFRDPLHADDLGRLIEALADKGVRGEKLNAGGGRRNLISVAEFLRRADPGAKVERAPGGDFGFAFSNKKAGKLAGWSPRILIRDRIPAIVENVRRGAAA